MEEGAAAVDSGPGQACEAYKNWKNINLGLGPLCGFENSMLEYSGSLLKNLKNAPKKCIYPET